MADADQRTLVAALEQQPVERYGSDQQRRRRRGRKQRNDIDRVAERVEAHEAGAEREGEQEAQQDLHAGEEHAEFLQQLGEVAVGALQRRLRPLTAVPSVVAFLTLPHQKHPVAYPAALDQKPAANRVTHWLRAATASRW